MYSENDTRHFFQLLRSGLKPDCAPAVTGKISARQWDDIFRMAADQGVCAVIGDGMERLPEKLRPPRDIRLRWALTAERQEKRYRRQQEKTAKMAAAFAENGIRMLVLKGLGLSRDYPVPAHRECGDIDIYLFGASDEGDRLLLQMGAQPYFDVPKHSSHTWDGILIENHRTILNVRRNRSERELNALLTAVLEQEGVCEIGENIAVPPATFNAIYLLRHAAVHYQKEGIAVRIVSVPSEGLFRDQPKSYQQTVLPQGVVRYGLTSGLPVTLLGLVGENGMIHGLDHFGYSAPYKVLDEKFGYNGQTVYEEVKKLISK